MEELNKAAIMRRTWDVFFAKAGSNWVAWVQSNLLKDEFLEYAKCKMQNAYSLLSHVGMQNANHGPKSTSENKQVCLHGEIIVYSRSTINTYSLLSHEWWVSLTKFMVNLPFM